MAHLVQPPYVLYDSVQMALESAGDNALSADESRALGGGTTTVNEHSRKDFPGATFPQGKCAKIGYPRSDDVNATKLTDSYFFAAIFLFFHVRTHGKLR